MSVESLTKPLKHSNNRSHPQMVCKGPETSSISHSPLTYSFLRLLSSYWQLPAVQSFFGIGRDRPQLIVRLGGGARTDRPQEGDYQTNYRGL